MIVHRLQARNALKYARVDLSDLPDLGRAILKGQVRGRVVVDVTA